MCLSGSMQSAIGNDSGTEKSRVEGVLESIQDLATCFRERRDDPTIEEALPLFRLFAIGFGFSDRAFKDGKLGALARWLRKDLPRFLSELRAVQCATCSRCPAYRRAHSPRGSFGRR